MDKKITIRLDEQMYDDLKEWSKQSGLKLSDSVRYLLQEGLSSLEA